MLGLGTSGRGQQPQMRGGPAPPQQQQPGNDMFNKKVHKKMYVITCNSIEWYVSLKEGLFKTQTIGTCIILLLIS